MLACSCHAEGHASVPLTTVDSIELALVIAACIAIPFGLLWLAQRVGGGADPWSVDGFGAWHEYLEDWSEASIDEPLAPAAPPRTLDVVLLASEAAQPDRLRHGNLPGEDALVIPREWMLEAVDAG
jgi:hypothetical protein